MLNHKQPARIIFMGTPQFAVPILQALQQAGYDICAIYTQPPRPAGRGHKETLSPVNQAAKSTPVFTPLTLQDAAEQKRFRDFNADLAVVAAYGLILPKPILEAPRLGCINVHASLLPRWRGASPIQQAILAGDSETGITLMKMDEHLDTGDIIAQRAVPMTSTTTAPDLQIQLSKIGAEMINQTVEDIFEGRATFTPQPHEGVLHAPKLTREQGQLNWQKKAVELDRQVRAFTPWPGSFFVWKDMTIKVVKATLQKQSAPAGTILDRNFTVACGEDALTLEIVQVPGKKPMTGSDFMNGYSLKAGQVL